VNRSSGISHLLEKRRKEK